MVNLKCVTYAQPIPLSTQRSKQADNSIRLIRLSIDKEIYFYLLGKNFHSFHMKDGDAEREHALWFPETDYHKILEKNDLYTTNELMPFSCPHFCLLITTLKQLLW